MLINCSRLVFSGVAVFHFVECVKQWGYMTPDLTILTFCSILLCTANVLTVFEMDALLSNSDNHVNNLLKTVPILIIAFCIIVQMYER